MSRQDLHLDAMLRHLGAAYYASLQNEAAEPEVRRAVDEVHGHLARQNGATAAAAPGQARAPRQRHHRLRSLVEDVMTTDVVTVRPGATLKQVAELLVERGISGVPVVGAHHEVLGMLTEHDVIAAKDKSAGSRKNWTGRYRYGTDRSRYVRLSAAQLMTSPAVTIRPGASLSAAAALMLERHVRRLPVTAADGVLVGLVSRADLLKTYVTPDDTIARHVREALAVLGPDAAAAVGMTVHGGVVTLTGAVPAPPAAIAAAVALAWEVDGVVDLIDHTVRVRRV